MQFTSPAQQSFLVYQNNNTNSLQNSVQNIKAKLAGQRGLLLFCKHTAYQPGILKEEAGTETMP